MSSQAIQVGAIIIPFPPGRSTSRRLLAQDRAEAVAWEKAARRVGYAQVSFADGPDNASEDLILAYRRGELWTVRGVAPPGRRFGLWHRTSGIKLGEFASVHAALEAIPLRPQAAAASHDGHASDRSQAR